MSWYRLFEMIPGLLVWTTFAGAFILSFTRPVWVLMFIIILSTLWLLRVYYFVFYLLFSWRKFQQAQRIDWSKRLQAHPQRNQIIHAIIVPTYTESFDVLAQTFEHLRSPDYPTSQIVVVLSGEERAAAHFTTVAERLTKAYHGVFRDLIVTMHPDHLPGELKAKGANAHWAGLRLQEYCDLRHIDYRNVIVSYFDCDTCVAPNYFNILTTTFLEHPNRYKTAFQPIAVFNNNIWASPMITRVSAFSTTFWLMSELARPDRLYTFSSHAMSMVPLVDVGFWQKDVVSDDSRIFLQCFLRYHGDFTITALYALVSMNTAMSNTWWKSMKNLYLQQRRWAYGVEHVPYLISHFIRDPRIRTSVKWKYCWHLFEGFYTWATIPILLFVFGRFPLWVMQWKTMPASVFVYNAPAALEWLMMFCMIGIITSALIGYSMLPHRPIATVTQRVAMFAQWILLPVNLILFGSIPATEAQTRLLLGTYLGFHVSDKVIDTV